MSWRKWSRCGALVALLAGASPSRAQEAPARPRFAEGVGRVQLACGRLIARLPRAITGGPNCQEGDALPSMLLGADRLEVSLEPDFVELVLRIEETPLSSAERASRRAEWAAWPSHFVTASPRLRIQRRTTGGLEVRVDDGSVFTVQIDWPDGESYVDEHQPPRRLLEQVDRASERLEAQLVLTLVPGPTRPMSPGRVTLPIEGEPLVMTLGEGVLVRARDWQEASRRDAEAGCPTWFEVLARDEGREPSYERGLVGVCRDGRIARGRSGRTLDPRIEAALATIRWADEEGSGSGSGTGTGTGSGSGSGSGTGTGSGSESGSECRFVVDDPAPPLRVRATFSSRSAILGTLDNGVSLELLERHGRWARIAAPVAGWVWTGHLRAQCP